MRPATKLLMCGGAGDFFAAEAHWTEADREALGEIHWLAPVRRMLQPLLEAHPIYKSCTHHIVKEKTIHADHTREAPAELHPYNLFRFFGLILGGVLPYRGSSFLKHDLAGIGHLGLPGEYVTLHPTTPINTVAERANRDLRADDWKEILNRLEERDLVAVVVNSEPTPLPRSPRLIDLQGKTSLAESIEVLKAGRGYYGIDSCLSVLAGQYFDDDNLLVYTRNGWLVANARLYYGPHKNWTWIRGHDLTPEAIERHRSEGGVFVRVLHDVVVGLRSHGAGEIVPVRPDRAEAMVASGKAEHFEP